MSHAQRGLHRRARKMLVVAPAVAAAAVGGSMALASSPAQAADGGWSQVRNCESGGNYATNTGNGFYGAYQFTQQTWNGLGYSGLPSDASPATQDEAAQKLYNQSGAGQWPVCGRFLTSGAGSAVSAGSTTVAPQTPSYSYTRTTTAPATAPETSVYVANPSTSSFPTAVFSTELVGQDRKDVRAWQQQANKLGAKIKVDGRYGPESAAAARSIQAKHRMAQDGVVGPKTWLATFAKAKATTKAAKK